MSQVCGKFPNQAHIFWVAPTRGHGNGGKEIRWEAGNTDRKPPNCQTTNRYCLAVGMSPVGGGVGGAMDAMVSDSEAICGRGPSNAIASTWSMLSTKWSFMALRRFSGTSARSFSFSEGRMASKSPARCAARSFSLSQPMGRTFPRSVISPVMAISRRTGMRLRALEIAVAMVMPADGPSLGIAPSGTCTWMSRLR